MPKKGAATKKTPVEGKPEGTPAKETKAKKGPKAERLICLVLFLFLFIYVKLCYPIASVIVREEYIS